MRARRKKIDKSSEAFRFQCEVNHVYKMTKAERDEYLAGVEKQRGKAAREKLWSAAYERYLDERKKGE
jgi:hypothetical protein